MIKKLLYLAIAVVALILVVAALLPGSYTVERSVEIAKPPEVVYPLVADYNNWLKWSPWPKMDPAAKQTVTGTPGGAGHSWSWEGEKSGVGSMTLAAVEPNRSVQSKLVFKEPITSEADDYILLEPTATGTRVTWRNTGNLPYPVGRFFGLGVEGMLGPQFEEGLAGVKSIAESIEDPPPPPETMTEEPAAETRPSTS
jgi:uncharacterized protein YndB with AHSA1/START domain